jgi:hypothetical protein
MEKFNEETLKYICQGKDEESQQIERTTRDLDYYNRLQKTNQLGRDIKKLSLFDIQDENNLENFLEKADSFFSFYKAPRIIVETDYLLDETKKCESEVNQIKKELENLIYESNFELKRAFKESYSELERWKKSEDIQKIKEIRTKLDKKTSLYMNYKKILKPIREIELYINKCSVEKRAEIDKKIEELKDFYFSNILNVKILKEEREKYFGGFFAKLGLSKGKLIEECESLGYYEGLIKVKEAKQEINYFIENNSSLKIEFSKIKKDLERLSFCQKNIETLDLSLNNAEECARTLRDLKFEINSYEKEEFDIFLVGFFEKRSLLLDQTKEKIEKHLQRFKENIEIWDEEIQKNYTPRFLDLETDKKTARENKLKLEKLLNAVQQIEVVTSVDKTGLTSSLKKTEDLLDFYEQTENKKVMIEKEIETIRERMGKTIRLNSIVREDISEKEIDEIEKINDENFGFFNLDDNPYIKKHMIEKQELMKTFSSNKEKMRQEAYETLCRKIEKIKQNPVEKEIRKTLDLCNYFRKVYNVNNEINELLNLKREINKNKVKSEYNSEEGLLKFLDKKDIPNKYEFYKIKEIFESSGMMAEKIEKIKTLLDRIKPENEEELVFLEDFRLAIREDKNKGYLAHCIDNQDLAEEEILKLIRRIDKTIRGYIPLGANAVY